MVPVLPSTFWVVAPIVKLVFESPPTTGGACRPSANTSTDRKCPAVNTPEGVSARAINQVVDQVTIKGGAIGADRAGTGNGRCYSDSRKPGVGRVLQRSGDSSNICSKIQYVPESRPVGTRRRCKGG